jgi:hypothetical protein
MQPDNKEKEQPILTLIQQIKDGSLDPGTIGKDLRQQCVEVFLGEGYTVASMAQVFDACEKTIRRDIDDIRERNAITPDISLAKKTIGEMVTYARIHRDYLMRLARAKDASVSEKSQAEYLAARVGLELIGKMQTLGYLPTKPQAIVGDIFHHVDGKISDLDELTKEIIDIENMADGNGKIDDGIKKDLFQMKTVLDKIRSSEETKIEEASNEDTRK